MVFFDNIREILQRNDKRRERALRLDNRKDDTWKGGTTDPYQTILGVFNDFSDNDYENKVRKYFPIQQDIENKKSFVPKEFKYDGNDYESKEYKQKVDAYYDAGIPHEILDDLLQSPTFVNTIIELSRQNIHQPLMRFTTYAIETGYNISMNPNLTEAGAKGSTTITNISMQLMKTDPTIKNEYASIALKGFFAEFFANIFDRFRGGSRRDETSTQVIKQATSTTKKSPEVQQQETRRGFSLGRFFGIKKMFTPSILANNETMASINFDKYQIIYIAKVVFNTIDHETDPNDAEQNTGYATAKNNSDKALDYLAREYRKTGSRPDMLRMWIKAQAQNSDAVKAFRKKTGEISNNNSGPSSTQELSGSTTFSQDGKHTEPHTESLIDFNPLTTNKPFVPKTDDELYEALGGGTPPITTNLDNLSSNDNGHKYNNHE